MLLIFAIVPIIIFLVWYFKKEAVIRRKLKKTPTQSIADCKNGETAKVIGQIEIFGDPLISPLSDRPCSHYYVHIEERVSSGKSSHWKTLIEEEISSHVIINDGTGHALINTKNLKSHVVQDKKFSSGFMNDATDRLEAYLKSHGHESEGFFGFNKKLRYKEGILEADEKIAVLGVAEWRQLESGEFGEMDKILVIQAPGDDSLYLTDDTRVTEA